METSEAIIESVCKNRWKDVRKPSDAELAATLFFRISIENAVAKCRDGHPTEKPEDKGTEVWTGYVPMKTVHEKPVTHPNCELNIPKELMNALD